MTEPVAKTAFDRLTEAAILTCPRCAGSLRAAGEGLVCDAGHETRMRRGVLDLYIAPEPATPADLGADQDEEVAAVFAQHLELPLDWVREAALLEPLPATGNGFLDAEEDLFLDRFALFNRRPRVEIAKVYATGRLHAGAANWIAVRVRNAGLFPLSSTSPKPLCLAYHWLDANGNMLVFEGHRSALPVDVKPGQAVTAHLQVVAPAAPGRYRLQIVPVHETVAWLDECAVTIEVDTSADVPSLPRSDDAGRPFDELLDNALAEAFIARRIAALPDPIRGLEIGGAQGQRLAGEQRLLAPAAVRRVFQFWPKNPIDRSTVGADDVQVVRHGGLQITGCPDIGARVRISSPGAELPGLLGAGFQGPHIVGCGDQAGGDVLLAAQAGQGGLQQLTQHGVLGCAVPPLRLG